MTKKALIALKLSIAHWKRMATGNRKEREGPFGPDCALCNIFLYGGKRNIKCNYCPVMMATGSDCCKETPFRKAYAAYVAYGILSPEFKKAARKELKFLRSLLPKEEK